VSDREVTQVTLFLMEMPRVRVCVLHTHIRHAQVSVSCEKKRNSVTPARKKPNYCVNTMR